MFCYSNSGSSMRAVDSDCVAEVGEVIFPDYPTDDELDTAFPGYKAQKSKDTANDIILAQIDALEVQQTSRRIREALLGTDSGWLANLNSQIQSLRAQLQK